MYLKVQLSYDRDYEKALNGAYQEWKTNIFESTLLTDLKYPEQFEAAAKFIRPNDLKNYVRISTDPSEHLDWINQDLEMGFDKIILHNVNLQQERFIEDFGRIVVPEFNRIVR